MAELTTEQVRERVVNHIHSLIDYWEAESRTPAIHDKLHGLAFSILTMLDGTAADLPGFLIIPNPHPDDKAYMQEEGRDWFPPCEVDATNDIGGWLHEAFCKRKQTE